MAVGSRSLDYVLVFCQKQQHVDVLGLKGRAPTTDEMVEERKRPLGHCLGTWGSQNAIGQLSKQWIRCPILVPPENRLGNAIVSIIVLEIHRNFVVYSLLYAEWGSW